MSLRINSRDIKCSKCSLLYIPFRKNFCCPNCGEPAKEFFDFIPEIIYSMNYHKRRYGRFFPYGWYVGSLTNHIQETIFLLFDKIEEVKPADPKGFIISSLDNMDWSHQPYLKNHVKDIVLAVYNIYKDDEGLQKNGEEAITQLTLLEKIKYWLHSLAP